MIPGQYRGALVTAAFVTLTLGCSDLAADRDGRGSTGTVVPATGGSAPVAGCAAGLTFCAGQCTDTTIDPWHCGGCDQSCTVGKSCIASQCVASASATGGASPVGGSGGTTPVGSGGTGNSLPLGGTPGASGSATGGSAGAPAAAAGSGGGTVGAAGSPTLPPTGCQPPAPGSTGQNPLFTDRFTADPAAMVHDCTFYITCGHDEGNTGFVMRDWYVLSSTDMVNWTDHGGPALSLDDFSWANANAWAAHMIPRGDRFYWYVPVNEQGGAMAIGVAVADHPAGPYADAIGGPLINDAIEMANWNFNDAGQTPYTIDPAPFVDDDGQAYLYYGSFWRVVGVRLNDDMISLGGPLEELDIRSEPPGGGFWEAPYMIKHGGTYYLIYAAGQNPATIDYATSDDPMGPFAYRGRILEQLPNLPGEDAATNHAGFAELAGQWYIVYHVSDGPGGGTYRRQVAVDKMHFNDDGTIDPVTPTSGLSF